MTETYVRWCYSCLWLAVSSVRLAGYCCLAGILIIDLFLLRGFAIDLRTAVYLIIVCSYLLLPRATVVISVVYRRNVLLYYFLQQYYYYYYYYYYCCCMDSNMKDFDAAGL